MVAYPRNGYVVVIKITFPHLLPLFPPEKTSDFVPIESRPWKQIANPWLLCSL
jgi:hypothetical protein